VSAALVFALMDTRVRKSDETLATSQVLDV